MELLSVLSSVLRLCFNQNAEQPTHPRKQNQQQGMLQTAFGVAEGAYTLYGLT